MHIEKYLSQCDVCLNHHYKQAKEPMMIAAHPTEPWEKVGTDLFQLNGKDYLVVIDYYSNYPEVEQLHHTTSNYVIQCMKSIFARHGIPHIVQSDNGPQYSVLVVNSKCLQNSMALNILLQAPFIQRQMAKQKKGSKL